MKYQLNKETKQQSESLIKTLKKFIPLLSGEKRELGFALLALLINSILQLVAPAIIGHAVDSYIVTKQFNGVLSSASFLLIIYLGSLVTSRMQTKLMGTVGQHLLFNLRNAIFQKLQQLPVAFFNQNKAGDLISRINNDTDKLNQFFSQSLMQFVGSIFMMTGAAIFIVALNPRLGSAALVPALGILIITNLLTAWVKQKNATSLKATGGMSAEIAESLNNFKVVVAFDRRDYFKAHFGEVNQTNFEAATSAGIANNIFTPIYGLAANLAQVIVLFYGIYLISQGQFTVGLLISYLTYLTRFYDPIRQLASLWSTFQVALAGWDRISEILALENDLPILKSDKTSKSKNVLEFSEVSFGYPDGKEILSNINFKLAEGKTYALVGPTGGGKTTTASLMARLFDPTKGTVLLNGTDIRQVSAAKRSSKIGFILQEPFLFSGTVRENILYGNNVHQKYSNKELLELIAKSNLQEIIKRFNDGLDTKVSAQGETMSLGQKQLIAFMRAVLRSPELLILDEATANIDTVTEQLLDEILKNLPKTTTKVVIAHRLNTIESADEIFFVNAGRIKRAGSLKHAIEMLMHGKKES